MWNIVWLILFVAVTRADVVYSKPPYSFCAPDMQNRVNLCENIKRGETVGCHFVNDSVDCALLLKSGIASFGIFDAEELTLAAHFYPDELMVIMYLKHDDTKDEDYEFRTVAVVSDYTDIETSPGNFDDLKGNGFCHPGFLDNQMWNDHILKYFERKVVHPRCHGELSFVENELKGIKDFFGRSCRPGKWAMDDNVDRELKRKYPELCALCDNPKNCSYYDQNAHGHFGALSCLKKSKVAYVALSYAIDFYNRMAPREQEKYQFLCPSGKRIPLTEKPSCAWIKQPWSAVVTHRNIAKNLQSEMMDWIKSNEEWKRNFKKLLENTGTPSYIAPLSVKEYLQLGKEHDFTDTDICKNRIVRWCTIGDLETTKCEWMKNAAIGSGVEPHISCFRSSSTFQCFRDIAQRRADVMAIDSNYGHLARTVYNLSTIMYSETKMDKNSVIIAVLRKDAGAKSFGDLKGRVACFPEYGGISWLSFMYIARTSGFVSRKSCDYADLTSTFFSGACTPGIKDRDHSILAAPTRVETILCSACSRGNSTCVAHETNRYYGDKGAMRCLSDKIADVAFVEVANIKDLVTNGDIDPNDYHVLCKNGSLATNTGFDVDDLCALSVTIDSEIIGRKNDPWLADISQALQKMENSLGYRYARRPMNIYNSFNGTSDLIFKDSSTGLHPSSTKQSVQNYKDLFSHLETCANISNTINNFSSAIIPNFIFLILIAHCHYLLGYAH